MKNDIKMQLGFNVESSLSFSYSSSGDKIENVGSVNLYMDLKLGKNSAGGCYVNLKDLITAHTKSQKSSFDKELTIKVYEKMIEDLNKEIDSLKKKV